MNTMSRLPTLTDINARLATLSATHLDAASSDPSAAMEAALTICAKDIVVATEYSMRLDGSTVTADEEGTNGAPHQVLAEPAVLREELLFPLRPEVTVHGSQQRVQMVRCVGMIQDIQDSPTFYQAPRAAFINPSTVLASCEASEQEDGSSHVLVNAQQLYVIPIPGNVAPKLESTSHSRAVDTSKDHRGRGSNATGAKRRDRDEESAENENATAVTGTNNVVPLPSTATSAAPASSKAPRREPPPSTANNDRNQAENVVGPTALNHPHPATCLELNNGCVVTLLTPTMQPGEAATTSTQLPPFPKLNDVVEFFGYVINRDEEQHQPPVDEEQQHGEQHTGPIATTDPFQGDEELSAYCRFEKLPPCTVAFMTCIAFRPLTKPSEVVAALGNTTLHVPRPLSATHDDASLVSDMRADTLQYLSEFVCSGDELAAEYLLLMLCSRVLTRSAEVPVGDFPLSFHHNDFSAQRASRWVEQLRVVLPVGCVMVDLCGKGANHRSKRPLLPRKDYDTNCIVTGQLQVAPGTLTVFSFDEVNGPETLPVAAEEPAATVRGGGGVGTNPSTQTLDGDDEEAIIALVHSQQVAVRYAYHTAKLTTDANVMLLTSAPVGELPPTLTFCLSLQLDPTSDDGSPTPCTAPGASRAPSAALLSRVRQYLGFVKDIMPDKAAGSTDDELRKQMADDLLNCMQTAPKQFNKDPVLHNNTANVRMSMARAFAASYGSSCISWANYEAAKDLEQRRYDRNNSFVAL